MHMESTLISTVVGSVFYVLSGGTLEYSVRKLKIKENKLILMGASGAFIFALQMLNFSIPYTGSSGHIGGGILLAVLLGPYAGFLTMSLILSVQCLFFNDGGLLALGCNIFNLGFFPCFIGYELIYKKIVKGKIDTKKIWIGSILSVMVSLELGAFFVALETFMSGNSEILFKEFLMLMLPIHLAIGLVEGIVTAIILRFIFIKNSDIMKKTTTATLLLGCLLFGGIFSNFASKLPDGLEWSIEKAKEKTIGIK
ncbi:energy-coupling factor ABC transporter permease [Cetobacterium sp. 2A]|uniref:energy-coupling factor ABC transporter permease n=1 Tax=Cetobacterium sp. 2A TaxID=2754723 RepID=UPI00163C7E5E|nr:energy-coupling factor ABC transporter permease [Cetobacterium sp. 2A]MBC2855059.1 energy-coupling factor ABC transporter permease [Cetobacterium sp. 2A]